MSEFITNQREIPKAPFYVVMDDKFFSGWGRAENMTATYIWPAKDYAEAEVVAENAKARGDQTRVRITANKPTISRSGHIYQVMDRDRAVRWMEPGYFAAQRREEKIRRKMGGGKKRHAAEKHTLRIHSLHDASATCSYGDWEFMAAGQRTREHIEHEFRLHLKNVRYYTKVAAEVSRLLRK